MSGQRVLTDRELLMMAYGSLKADHYSSYSKDKTPNPVIEIIEEHLFPATETMELLDLTKRDEKISNNATIVKTRNYCKDAT